MRTRTIVSVFIAIHVHVTGKMQTHCLYLHELRQGSGTCCRRQAAAKQESTGVDGAQLPISSKGRQGPRGSSCCCAFGVAWPSLISDWLACHRKKVELLASRMHLSEPRHIFFNSNFGINLPGTDMLRALRAGGQTWSPAVVDRSCTSNQTRMKIRKHGSQLRC